MEEAVTKKYVHEESSSVTSLCGAVEACLSHGLRRRALGLFKTSSTTALIQKIAKICPEADYVTRRLLELELSQETPAGSGKRSSSSSDSIIKPKLLSKGSGSSSSVNTINTVVPNISNGSASAMGKYLWIRLALYEKRLAKIIEHLVSNAQSYYDREALVADPDYGSILSSLLVGPCALEFTRAKTANHYWSDPRADELVSHSHSHTLSLSLCICHCHLLGATSPHQLGQPHTAHLPSARDQLQAQPARQLGGHEQRQLQGLLHGLCGVTASELTHHTALWQEQCAGAAQGCD